MEPIAEDSTAAAASPPAEASASSENLNSSAEEPAASKDADNQEATTPQNDETSKNDDTANKKTEEEAEAVIHSVLADAADRIDEQLSQMRGSRRLFYRDNSKRNSSWAHLSTSVHGGHDLVMEGMDEEDLDDSDEEEEIKQVAANAAKTTTGQYADFLASAANIQVLQTDLAQAEEIFYKDYATNKNQTSAASAPAAASTATAASNATTATQPRYKMQQFNPIHYDDVEHVWKKRPFTVDFMKTFFGTIDAERMDELVRTKRSTIAKNGSWDPEGLVLTDLGRPFRSKLMLSVNDEGNLPNDFKVEYLSGTFVSYVYKGEYEKFQEWVEDAMKKVKEKYGKKPTVYKHFYAYYPSRLEKQAEESMVVFFIRVGKLK